VPASSAHLASEDIGENKAPDDEESQDEKDLQLLGGFVVYGLRNHIMEVAIPLKQTYDEEKGRNILMSFAAVSLIKATKNSRACKLRGLFGLY